MDPRSARAARGSARARRRDEHRDVLDDVELALLIVGHVVGNGHHALDDVESAQSSREVGLRDRELVGEILQRLGLELEEGVILEERAAAGQVGAAEVARLGLQARRQRRGGFARALRPSLAEAR